MLQFVFPSLLKSAYKYWCIIYSKQITTTTTTTIATTTNDKVNANSGPGPVIQIIGQGRKYNQNWGDKVGINKLRPRTGNKIVGQGQ